MLDNTRVTKLLPATIACIAFGSSFAQAQGPGTLTQKVTFTIRAAPAKRVIQEIADKTGVSMLVSSQTADNVLAIKVKDVTLQQLMDKIAETLHGDWTKEQAGYRLGRAPEKAEKDRKDELAQTVAAFKATIDEKLKKAGPMKPFDQSTARLLAEKLANLNKEPDDSNTKYRLLEATGKEGPAGRAMRRLLESLDPATVANTPENMRVVYSNLPTKSQRPLPLLGGTVLKGFTQEQNLWTDVVKAIPTEANQSRSGNDPLWNRIAVTETPKILLAIVKQPFGIGADLELIFAKPNGQVIARAREQLTPDMEQFQQEMTKSSANSTPVELTPLSKKLLKKMQSFQRARDPNDQPDPELLKALAEPEKNDPLSFATTDALFAMADEKAENVVAYVPDVMFAVNLPFGDGQQLTTSQIRSVMKILHVQADEENGWMEIMPMNPTLNRTLYLDRNVLGTFLRSIQKEGRASLDAIAAYALVCPTTQFDLLGMPLAGLFDPALGGQIEGERLYAYRFYGAMSPSMRQAMRNNGKVSLSSLTPKQKQTLELMVYSSNPNLNYGQPMPTAVDSASGIDLWDNINREPTEALPNGIPADGSVTFYLTDSQVLLSGGDGGWDASAVGQLKYQADHPEIFPGQSLGDRFENVQLAKRMNIQMDFTFNEKVGMSRYVRDIFAQGKPAPYAQLPESFRKEVDKAYEQAKQMFRNYKPGQGQTAPPPPPSR